MEASAGDDKGPGGLRGPTALLPPPAPAAPQSAQGRGLGAMGGALELRTEPAAGSLRSTFSGCSGPAVRGRRLSCQGVPACSHPPLSVFLPARRRLLNRARRLQQRLQRRCAKRAGAVRAGGTAEGERTQVRRPRRSGRGPCVAPSNLGAACDAH